MFLGQTLNSTVVSTLNILYEAKFLEIKKNQINLSLNDLGDLNKDNGIASSVLVSPFLCSLKDQQYQEGLQLLTALIHIACVCISTT